MKMHMNRNQLSQNMIPELCTYIHFVYDVFGGKIGIQFIYVLNKMLKLSIYRKNI